MSMGTWSRTWNETHVTDISWHQLRRAWTVVASVWPLFLLLLMLAVVSFCSSFCINQVSQVSELFRLSSTADCVKVLRAKCNISHNRHKESLHSTSTISGPSQLQSTLQRVFQTARPGGFCIWSSTEVMIVINQRRCPKTCISNLTRHVFWSAVKIQ